MEERIRERFNPAILEEALRRYGVTPDHARLLDGFESFMYEFGSASDEYILRLGHSLRRSEILAVGERLESDVVRDIRAIAWSHARVEPQVLPS